MKVCHLEGLRFVFKEQDILIGEKVGDVMQVDGNAPMHLCEHIGKAGDEVFEGVIFTSFFKNA